MAVAAPVILHRIFAKQLRELQHASMIVCKLTSHIVCHEGLARAHTTASAACRVDSRTSLAEDQWRTLDYGGFQQDEIISLSECVQRFAALQKLCAFALDCCTLELAEASRQAKEGSRIRV